MRKIAIITLMLLSSIVGVVQAQTDNQFWSALAINGPVQDDSRWLLWFDGHARFRNDANNLGTSIIRPAVGYRVNNKLDVWLGYARVTSHIDGPDIEEDRIWQQATFPIANFWGGNLSGRSRLEQRFRDDQGDDTGHRFRQFLRWARPLSNPNLSLVVWDELFVGLNDADWGQRQGFDQNRLFVGLGWQLHPKWRLETGYMSNFINPPGGDDSVHNNVLSITLFGAP